MATETKGVWSLQQVRDQILAGGWAVYDYSDFPSGGELWVWGNLANGTLGLNTTIKYSSPVQVPGTSWYCVGGMAIVGLATKTDCTLWYMGGNGVCLAGIGIPDNRSSPIQIPGNWICSNSTYFENTHFALRPTNELFSWGKGGGTYPNYGIILGLNQSVGDNSKSSPTQIPGSWCTIAVGAAQAMGIKTDGTLWVWGCNQYGTLGDNTVITRSSPRQIPGTQWTSINSGWCGGLATKSDGTLWSWGYSGGSGVLGLNSSINRSSPTQIPGTAWVYACRDVTSTGIALKTDGTLWGWGSGTALYNNIARSSPTQIPGNQWAQFGVGRAVAGAVKNDGTLWVWGSPAEGALGLNSSTVYRSSPTQIPGTNWIRFWGNGYWKSAAVKG